MVWQKDILMLFVTNDLEVRHFTLDKLTIFDHVVLLSVVAFSIINDLTSVDFWKVVILNAYAEGNCFKF